VTGRVAAVPLRYASLGRLLRSTHTSCWRRKTDVLTMEEFTRSFGGAAYIWRKRSKYRTELG
jgi:hypothetical protein